jgi:hypothetical protein
MVSCVDDCPGDLTSTARICRSDAECPPNIPKCTMFTLNGLAIYACSTP